MFGWKFKDWRGGCPGRGGGRNTAPRGCGGLRLISPARGIRCFAFLAFFSPCLFLRPFFRFDLGYIFEGVVSLTWRTCPLGGGKHIDYVVLCCICMGGSRQFKSSLYNRNRRELFRGRPSVTCARKSLYGEGLFLLVSSIMLGLFLWVYMQTACFVADFPLLPPATLLSFLSSAFSLCLFSLFSSFVLYLCMEMSFLSCVFVASFVSGMFRHS